MAENYVELGGEAVNWVTERFYDNGFDRLFTRR